MVTPDGFPAGEDPVPAGGNPHSIHGMPVHNPNAVQHWHHDHVGAPQGVQGDVGLNDQHMQDAVDDLAEPQEEDPQDAEDWPEWFGVGAHIDQNDAANQEPEFPPQDTISFDQSGSTAQYLRANGPDIVLTVEDVLAGVGSSSSSNSATSSESDVQVDQPPRTPLLQLLL